MYIDISQNGRVIYITIHSAVSNPSSGRCEVVCLTEGRSFGCCKARVRGGVGWGTLRTPSRSYGWTSELGKGKGHPRRGHEGPEGEYRYSCTLSLTSALDGVSGQRHAPVALPPGKTRYPLYRRLSGPQGRPGRARKISPPTGIRSPDRPARSKSLYRLSYPGPPSEQGLYKVQTIHKTHTHTKT